MTQQEKFDQVFDLMKASFPESEYRDYKNQRKLLSDPRYQLLTEENKQGEVIAFLAGWEFADFRYVENIAVSPSIRGGGIGKQLMNRFMRQSTFPIVLEVEDPKSDLQRRRVRFYERLGFRLGEYKYVQPPLREEIPGLPLRIMSYPEKLTASQFEQVKDVLYREVYNVQQVSNPI
ncbi:GNAT family N-acetyltransferase [Paenibacillus sp. An7]|uniref:GNAT family N-acetyltransferase n=1 Tax=Paenibacillus sp. An7 TaxID=2689577 RepID=UPI001F17F36B|nr:GNAT family N-acetyltransferase [Paenibacillus sp. An7]